MALAVHVHPSRFAQAPGRVKSFTQRCWDLSIAVSQLGKLAAGAVGGGLEAALAFAPPALPGAGSWGGGGGPACPAVPSSGMLALLPGWEKSLWS